MSNKKNNGNQNADNDFDDDSMVIDEIEDLDELYHNKNKKELEILASYLLNGKNVLWITGAGLSVPSGLQPYRGSKNAIWENFIYEWGTRQKFIDDNVGFWNTFWLSTHEKREYMEALPNLGHYAISNIVETCNCNVITQNIDALHIKSKVPIEKLIEIHGRISLYKCINEICEYSWEKTITDLNIDDYGINNTSLLKGNLQVVPPPCPGCTHPILPQSLLFDEQYASHSFYRYDQALEWIDSADVYIFVGTSFSVGITDSILEHCRKNSAKKMFNFNLYKENIPKMKTIIGPSEITLPLLHREIINQTKKRTGPKIWYNNSIKRIVNENSVKV